jgi:tRNA threonylcarbamoyladenosine biosynthesis protein TsaB
MAVLLGIESSSEYCTVLLSRNGEIMTRMQHTESFAHAAVLTRMIARCLDEVSLKMDDLEGIYISMGPGSYTSLRVGVSTAKGIAFAQNIPVLAIPTLKIFALSALKYHQIKDGVYAGIIDAGRMEVYLGFYDNQGNEIEGNKAMILEEDSFSDFSHQAVIFAGNGIRKAQNLYRDRKNLVWTSTEIDWEVFARLGDEKFKSGVFADLVHGEPVYLKPPNITIAKSLH